PLALLLGFSLALARGASGMRWAGTTAASTAVGLRVVAFGFNAAAGRSLPSLPLGILIGGLAFDLVRRGRVRPILAAWAAAFAAQAAWLQLTGKTWWGSHVLLPGLVIGAVAALIGAALGSGVGHALATTAGRRSRAPSPKRIVRWGAPAGAAVLIASLVSAAGYGQLIGQG